MLQQLQESLTRELTVDEFVQQTKKSIEWISIYTGMDTRTIFRHKNKADDTSPKYVQFRRHLALLAQNIK